MIYDSRSGLADSAYLGGICAADIKYRQGRIVVIVGCDHIQEAAAVLCMDKIGIQRIEHILGHAGPVSDFDLQAVISIAVLTFRYDSGYGEGFCTAIPVQISLLLYVGLQPCDIAALRGAVCAGEEIFVIPEGYFRFHGTHRVRRDLIRREKESDPVPVQDPVKIVISIREDVLQQTILVPDLRSVRHGPEILRDHRLQGGGIFEHIR